VALKVIKLGMDTKEVIARFEQERQALAMMDHPNIAKVLDAGATEHGRPFFVMELVRGLKITDYCDEQKLSTQERIALFITVCQAVQHAHQKGIIHRDLKPSNILVTVNDGKAVPKVIDFGVAKATQGRLTDATVYTQFQQMIGTPLYMSPEQADMTSLDIDTRSDIYALGVLLYELLTGHTPIEQDTLARIGLDEMRCLIREVDPPRPSLRMKTLDGAEMTTAAKRRITEPAKLSGALRGDLDWIVMKCLEKDRKRRYDTANDLAFDLQRHLKNEVITARPPTAGYLLSKLIRRNKFAFAAGTAIAASLVIGLGVATWMFLKEREARRRAVAAEQRESAMRATAQANERRATTEAAKSQQVASFLQEMLKGVRPAAARGKDTEILIEILEATDGRLTRDLREQPVVEAQLRATLGEVFYDMGEYERASVMFRRGLDLYQAEGADEHREAISRLQTNLGVSLAETGGLQEAGQLAQAGLASSRALFPNAHRHLAHALQGFGLVGFMQGNYSQAETSLREQLSILEELGLRGEPAYATALNNLSWVLDGSGQADESERLSAEALTIVEKLYGEKHPDYILSLNNVALSHWFQGRLREAAAEFGRSLALGLEVMKKDHIELANPHNNLALALRDLNEFSKAEEHSRKALALIIKGRGPDHELTQQARKNLASILRRHGDATTNRTLGVEALGLSPQEWLTVDALAALSLRSRWTALSTTETSGALVWRYTSLEPAKDWTNPDFDDRGWTSTPPPVGAPTFHPRTPKAPVRGHTRVWLRREIHLDQLPRNRVVFLVGKYQDAKIYVNGVSAGPPLDWSDTECVVVCSSDAQATLRPGKTPWRSFPRMPTAARRLRSERFR
jgi:tetratricopeptide (TPR) repeat protein